MMNLKNAYSHKASQNVILVAMIGQLLSSTLVIAPAHAATFTDIQGYWAQAGIEKLANQQILGGYPDGTFRPEGLVTRAEFATVLTKAIQPQVNISSIPSFRDVPPHHWAYRAVESVRTMGWVGGYPDGTFHPAQPISRAEALVMMAKVAALRMPSDAEVSQILSQYPDAYRLPSWARPAAAAALSAGISANYPNPTQIRPGDMATRGEVAALTDRLTVALANTQPGTPVAQNPNYNTPNYNPNLPGYPGGALQGRVSMVPANTKFTGTMTSAVSSSMTRVGDSVELKLDQPLMGQDNTVVIPWGSLITGTATEVKPAGRLGENGSMKMVFTEIKTPDGRRIPIQASVATTDGVLDGGNTKGRILKALGTTAIGAGLGAALGTAMGPLSGGKVGKGAIYGTAVGAGVGAVAAGLQKGKDTVLQSGDRLEIILNQPISVEAGQ